MKKLVTLILLLLIGFTYGQTQNKKSSISTGGGSAASGNTKLVYAIGEVAIQEQTQGNNHVSEGFVGPDIATLLGVTEYNVLQGIAIYPNPVQDQLNIRFETSGSYEIYLYDLNGKQLFKKHLIDNFEAGYDLSSYQAAVYFLFIIDRENKLSKQLKIVKL